MMTRHLMKKGQDENQEIKFGLKNTLLFLLDTQICFC